MNRIILIIGLVLLGCKDKNVTTVHITEFKNPVLDSLIGYWTIHSLGMDPLKSLELDRDSTYLKIYSDSTYEFKGIKNKSGVFMNILMSDDIQEIEGYENSKNMESEEGTGKWEIIQENDKWNIVFSSSIMNLDSSILDKKYKLELHNGKVILQPEMKLDDYNFSFSRKK
jgi:hypothetical protein